MYNVIDSKYQETSFGAGGKTRTTMNLIEVGPDKFGLSYDVAYTTSIFDSWHHSSGGPFDVSGNTSTVVNETPKVTVTVSNYSDDRKNHLISMHVVIDVSIIGVIYDQTLGGRYGAAGFQEFVANLSATSK